MDVNLSLVSIKRIEQNELKSAWHMQQRGFLDVFLRYFDYINPIFNTYKKFKGYYKKFDMYWIIFDNKPVGQIWIGIKDNSARLARIFVIKEYRNQGIAQQAIKTAETFYPECNIWLLDTIKQEKRNCHLYEKLGYIPSGTEKRINKRMTIIDYEKRLPQ